MEEIEFILDTSKESMQKTIGHLEVAFSKIRAGKASPQMLDSVSIGLLWIFNTIKSSFEYKHSRC